MPLATVAEARIIGKLRRRMPFLAAENKPYRFSAAP